MYRCKQFIRERLKEKKMNKKSQPCVRKPVIHLTCVGIRQVWACPCVTQQRQVCVITICRACNWAAEGDIQPTQILLSPSVQLSGRTWKLDELWAFGNPVTQFNDTGR